MLALVKVPKYLLLLPLLFLFGCITGYSQNYSLDSIKKVLATEMHDTTRLRTIGVILENENQRDSISIYYNKQVIAIITKNLQLKELDYKLRNTYLYYLAYWYADQAVILSSKKSSPETIAYLDKAAAIFNYLNMPDEYWLTINNKGNALIKIAEYEKALACFFDALKYNELKKNKLGVAASHSSIGSVYLNQNKFNEAISFYNKALNYFDSIRQPENKDLYEKAVINFNLGVCYHCLKNNAKARMYILQALAIEKENNFLDNMSFAYDRLAKLSIEENKPDEALMFYEQGLSYAKNDRTKGMLLNDLGRVYLEKKNYPEAIAYLTKSLTHINAAKDLQLLEYVYFNLYKAYKATGQLNKSLQMFELYVDLQKSNNSEAYKNALAQKQLKHDYEKKELQATLDQEKKLSDLRFENERNHTRKNKILYGLLFLTIMLGLSIFYLVNFFKQKNIITANKANELKQKLLRTQMNPHFIFNSVDNIQSLIYSGKGTEAISYLSKFSKLTRQILENSNENYITLDEELEMIENYLKIQQLLYNNKFTYTILADETVDRESTQIPPMLTQPFIENAIKHGLKNQIGGGEVHVRFYQEGEALFFEVRDNGSGIGQQDLSGKHRSMSLHIVNERLASSKSKRKIQVQLENLTENNTISGARTWFEIPYLYEPDKSAT